MADKKAMTAQDQKFLDAYKDLEQACRDRGFPSVMDYEKHLEDMSRPADASCLRSCRQVRNFLAHEGGGFLAATKQMEAFVKKLAQELRLAGGTVKDRMATAASYGCVTTEDQIGRAVTLACRKPYNGILVVSGSDGKYMGRLDMKALGRMVRDGASLDSAIALYSHILSDQDMPEIAPDVPLDSAPEGLSRLVTDPKTGRLKGIWEPGKPWRHE